MCEEAWKGHTGWGGKDPGWGGGDMGAHGWIVDVGVGCPCQPLSPHGWSAGGLHPVSCKQPVWAAGDTPHLMPVEQGLPWHPIATGLAGEALPCVVATSHAHALPSSSFWFPVSPGVLAAPPTSLPPISSSSAALSVSRLAVLLLPLSVGACGWHPCAPASASVPPYKHCACPHDAD